MPGKLKIFLIEDDNDDRELLEVALEDSHIDYELRSINRGDLIVDWLETNQVIPDIIIMDLNLPKLHGREVICKIKENPRYASIPFLVLTTSSSIDDKQYCLDKGADLFMSKPSDMDGFGKLITSILKLAGKAYRQA